MVVLSVLIANYGFLQNKPRLSFVFSATNTEQANTQNSLV